MYITITPNTTRPYQTLLTLLMPDQKASGKTSWGKTNKPTKKTENQKQKEENEDVA